MKIFKLFIDENIKTWKKFSTKLAIFLIFLALIAALGMAKITQNLDAKNNGQTVYYEGNWKEDVEADIYEYLENSFEELIWEWGYLALITGKPDRW